MSPETLEYCFKFLIPFIVICTSLFNLTFKRDDHHLWLVLLCSCITYLIPSPEIKQSIKTIETYEKALPK